MSCDPTGSRVVLSREDVGERVLALTFDDGPSAWTPLLLDLLAGHGARATFFVLGEAVAGREDVLRRAVGDGHELGNHTFSHAHPGYLEDDALREELERTGALVERVSGVRPQLVRPPYGEDPDRVARIAGGLGLGPTVLWSVDPKDWSEPPAGAIAGHVVRAARPGAIVDLHDGLGSAPEERTRRPTVDALAEALPALAERGYRCVTLSELLAAE